MNTKCLFPFDFQVVESLYIHLEKITLSIEELADHLLGRCLRLIHDKGDKSSSLILVLWELEGRIVHVSTILAISSLKPAQHLSGSTALLLYFLGTLEENMVASKDLHKRVPLKVLLRPVLCNVIAAPVAILHALNPLRVFSGKGSLGVHLLPHLGHVHVHIDLEVIIKHAELAEDTGKVANAAGQVKLPVGKVHLEFLLVLLSGGEETTLSLPLVSVEEGLEGVLPSVLGRGWQGLEFLLELSEGVGRLGEGVPGLAKIFTLLHSLIKLLGESHHILVTPADHLTIEGVDVPPDSLFHITHASAEGRKTAQGDQEPHHPAAVFR